MIARACLLFLAMAAAAEAQYLRGVNVAGAEFGDTTIPGTIGQSHTYNSARTFQYFASRSLGFIRLAVRWERLQPVLRGPLDTTNLNALKQDIQWAKAAGCQISIDIHNYARYKMNEAGTLNTYTIDNMYNGSVKVSAADLADFWVRLSNELEDDPTVYAYDLMNEPHDMGGASWRTISQTVVSAIRANGDGKLIMVPGDNWSAAQTWPSVHGPTSWISDPMNNFLYEAHQYFDSDNSGTYARSYDQELSSNPNLPMIGPTRLSPFINWCKTNNIGCYLGEYGSPNNDSRWNTVLDNFLMALDAAGIGGTYWAAGEWWGNYALSVQPLNNFTTDRVQMRALLSHLAPGAFTSAPAAAVWGYSVAPGSLVAGFGTNLAGSGTQVQLTGSSGSKSTAQIVSNNDNQVNYLVPSGTPPGRVDVVVTNGGKTVGTGVLEIEPIAPAVFSANNDGKGVAAALVLRVKPDGTQAYENVAQFDQSRNQLVARPLSFDGDRLFLNLFGTGFAGGTASNATLQINSVNVAVSYAGPQNQYPGLDQVNAELPSSLAGSGEVTVSFAVSGKPSNPVTIAFK